MNPIEAITSVFSNYTNFRDRASRSEFWWWWLANIIFCSIAYTIAGDIGSGIYVLAIFIPNLAVTVRRHHDGNRSGWWILLGIIPFIGPLVLLFWYVSKGTEGPNQYGPDPLRPEYGDEYRY
ncbi:DUF805 domain-containing protein [Pseudemcibacter aquimaris]|uniref:DUF805 domain-containing protein n=1 Tax=Pseudemcibacter aquimaris TaxID=2857064 RepID=UPI0020126906|nr:DUF805 domain-containing protein [Pseudemcibacter aquimaris]MCC3859911.1 DUF805 domain-containing protein [Pseudemcibacter aquimaris]WDU57243.1 DUF805 domain-containing protein [Pseudemcibacter aquimaris]